MGEERERYRNREIVIKTEEGKTEEGRLALAEESIEKKPELYIDGKHITTVRDAFGVHIAGRLAYAPSSSLKNLAKKIIDYEEATSSGR